MPSKGSVTHWIEEIASGGDRSVAAQALWERYFEKLVGVARRKLRQMGDPRRVADEEDVVANAFESYYRAAGNGRFPDLGDRDGLWRLLLTITARKATDLVRRNKAQKRRVLGESVLKGPNSESAGWEIGQVIGQEPTPEFVAMVIEQVAYWQEQLPPDLQELASAKLEGYTNEELAERLDCSVRTVERRLNLIRAIWERGPEAER